MLANPEPPLADGQSQRHPIPPPMPLTTPHTPPANRQGLEDNGRPPLWVGVALVACSLLAVWITGGLWQDGMPLGADMARHFHRLKVMDELFLPAGHIDGWSPYWHLGVQQFLFQSYGYFLVMALAHRFVGDGVSLLGIFKFFLLLPYALLPWAVYYLSRRFRLAPGPSVFAGFISLGTSIGSGFGVAGLYYVGLILQGPGVLLVAVGLPNAMQGLRQGGPRLWVGAIVAGITLVFHFMSGVYLLATLGVYAAVVALSRCRWPILGRYFALALVALALSAHALLRPLQLQQMMGGTVGWGSTGPWPSILQGTFMATVPISWLAYASVATAIWRRHSSLAPLGWIFILTLALAGSSRVDYAIPLANWFIGGFVRPRALPNACLFFAVFAGFGVQLLMEMLPQARARFGRRTLGAIAAVLVAVLIVPQAHATWKLRRLVRTEKVLPHAPRTAYFAVIDWLRRNAPPGSVVAYEGDVFLSHESGSPKLASVLNREADLYALGGDQVELTDVRHHRFVKASTLLHQPVGATLRQLRRLNVRYVLLRSSRVIALLEARPEVERATVAGSVTILHIRGPKPFARGHNLDIRLLEHQAERIEWIIDNPDDRARGAVLALSRHPNWQATVDDVPTAMNATRDRLLKLRIGPGRHTVVLEYQRSTAEYAYAAISMTALIFALIAVARSRAVAELP